MSLYFKGRELTPSEIEEWKFRFFLHVLDYKGDKNPHYLADNFKRYYGIMGGTRWGKEFLKLADSGGLFELEMRRLINED